MRTEANLLRIHPEIKPNSSVVTSNVSFVNFSGPDRGLNSRNKITGIGALHAQPLTEVLPTIENTSNILKFPETKQTSKIESAEISPLDEVQKNEAYNPSRRANDVIKETGRLLIRRVRRASRCNGSHDAETDPCGSPRCRTKNKAKMETRQTAGKEKTTVVKSPRHVRTKIVFGKRR